MTYSGQNSSQWDSREASFNESAKPQPTPITSAEDLITQIFKKLILFADFQENEVNAGIRALSKDEIETIHYLLTKANIRAEFRTSGLPWNMSGFNLSIKDKDNPHLIKGPIFSSLVRLIEDTPDKFVENLISNIYSKPNLMTPFEIIETNKGLYIPLKGFSPQMQIELKASLKEKRIPYTLYVSTTHNEVFTIPETHYADLIEFQNEINEKLEPPSQATLQLPKIEILLTVKGFYILISTTPKELKLSIRKVLRENEIEFKHRTNSSVGEIFEVPTHHAIELQRALSQIGQIHDLTDIKETAIGTVFTSPAP